ncbi:MAG TPA: hypothetical protein VF172_03040 [Nitrososphaera sp.]
MKQRSRNERKGRRKRKRKPGRPSSGTKCPRCGKAGSPQLKVVKNRKGGGEYKYVYYAHPTGPHTVRWCYVGGRSLSAVSPSRKQKRVHKRKWRSGGGR